MKIYATVYERGWSVEEIESGDLKRIGIRSVARYRKGIGYFGNVYRDDTFFKTREAAERYIHKLPVPAEDRFEFS